MYQNKKKSGSGVGGGYLAKKNREPVFSFPQARPHIYMSPVLTTALRVYYYVHFADEKTKVQTGLRQRSVKGKKQNSDSHFSPNVCS